jgi:hypothetical protein
VAGLVPGFLMIGLVCAYGVYVGIKNKTPRTPFVLRDALSTMWIAKWELLLPVFIGGAIIGGWATIVESAAIACAYAIFVEVVIFKDIPVRELPATVVRGATLVGAVLIVLGVALGLTSYLVDADVPSAVITWVRAHIETQFGFLLVLNILLLVLGSVLETDIAEVQRVFAVNFLAPYALMRAVLPGMIARGRGAGGGRRRRDRRRARGDPAAGSRRRHAAARRMADRAARRKGRDRRAARRGGRARSTHGTGRTAG